MILYYWDKKFYLVYIKKAILVFSLPLDNVGNTSMKLQKSDVLYNRTNYVD